MNKKSIFVIVALAASALLFVLITRRAPLDSAIPVEKPIAPTKAPAPPPAPPFAETDLARQWQADEGYLPEDILAAQDRMRADGLEAQLNQPEIIRHYLPPRVVTSVRIERIRAPERVRTGEPIPFTVIGSAPVPKFNFTRFDVVRQGEIIRIRALGHSPAHAGEATTVVEQSGVLDPLPPGTYQILVPAVGPDARILLFVEP